MNTALRKEHRNLASLLEGKPLLAQGSVFQIDPPEDAPRASTTYMWTRKVKGKTVTRGLRKDQYEALKAAIATNRSVEESLKRIRTISQNQIVPPLKKHPTTRRRTSS